MGDAEGYRPKGELDSLRARDCIPAMKARMMAEDGMTQAENDAIVARARAKVDEAIEFGRQSPYAAPAEAMDKVFA
jgi:pyruvate dehydrogenase E1 component alpha subunit